VKRSYSGMLLSMLAVFASGIGVGALGHHLYTVKTVSATTSVQPPKRTPEEWRRIYVSEMQQRLQLDEKQLTGLNTILDDTRTQFHSLKDKQKKESDQLRAEQTNKIRAMLSPPQRSEYEKFREERDRKMKAEQAAREQAAKEQASKAQAGKAGN